MKLFGRCSIKRVLPACAFWLVLTPAMALAASPEWRPKYDQIMMYVNFIILAAVIVKFAREPLKNFLSQQKAEVVSEIEKLEAEKKRILDEIKAANEQAAESTQRFQEMKERLISQGETKKQQIVDQARLQSNAMIEETRKKMENRILQAKAQLKMELADMAFDQAMAKLPQVVNDEDNQRFLDDYMQGMHLAQDAQS